MNFGEYNNIERIKLSEDTKLQLENLGLKVGKLNGKILDVGAGDGSLAKELKDKFGIDITAVDLRRQPTNPSVLVAEASDLPFEDESFDKIISHASIPNIFLSLYDSENPESSKEKIKEKMLKTFREMIRLLKPNSSVIMSPVGVGDIYDSEKTRKEAMKLAIDELKEDGVEIKFEFLCEVEDPDNKERRKSYRLTLTKKLIEDNI